jgi:feruloyl-CoA synthase
MSEAPRARLNFAPAEVDVEHSADGGMILTSPQALAPHERQLGLWLRRWAGEAPERTFLAERGPDGAWRRLDYGAARAGADAISQALLDRGLGPERPLMALSANAIDLALLLLGAMQVGIPAVPVSPAYSLMSRDFTRLKHIHGVVEPALIYAADGEMFGPALGALDLDLGATEVMVSARPPQGLNSSDFQELLATPTSPAVDQAFNRVGPDSVAKVLFTSGSTGFPKGVLNTQRMLCSNQQAVVQLWPFVAERPPVLVDWLPWNHTFGGNHDFNMVLRNGGTLYIDAGRPLPGRFAATVDNLREVSPTIYFNVPAGYGMLLPELERDEALRESFFRDLDMVFYAGAALPQDLWRRMEEVSTRATGRRPVMASAWGSTETAPMATTVHFPIDRAGVMGLPAPGTAIKLVPAGDKLELRVKGANVFPGYLKEPELTREAFDDEGFYRIGDAGKLIDPDDPAKGLAFDGRTGESFKLTTGTWVHAGSLRLAALEAATPALQDAVVTGHDRDWVGLLAWPSLAGCRGLAGSGEELGPEELIRHTSVRAHVTAALRAHNAEQAGSSMRIARLLLMAEPPSMDANEITDKGYVNQAAVLACRRDLVERLYADVPDDEVIAL